MVGVEIDFVVQNSLTALALYEEVFQARLVEATNFPPGQNEAIFTIYGTRFHIMDESRELGLLPPGPGAHYSIWFNLTVPNIFATHQGALAAGCSEIKPVKEEPDYGVSSSMVLDPFGYAWMLHQVHRQVSAEERMKLWGKEEKTT